MIKPLLALLAKPFIGSGIGQKLPWLHHLYRQLYTSTGSGTLEVTIPLGLSYKVQDDDNGPGLFIRSKGSFEPFQTQLFIEATKKDDTFYDIGAHVGYYSLIASKAVGDNGKVLSFEPTQENLKLLKYNLDKNQCANVEVIEKAVGADNGEIEFYVSTESSGDHSLVKRSDKVKVIKVPLTTVDTITQKTKNFPSIMKIDVEGAEVQVLKGMTKTLANKDLHTIFIEISQHNQQGVIEVLEQHSFTLHLIDEHKQTLVNYSRAKLDDLIDHYGFINLLARR